ncbi:hypothetical protein G6F37_001139 [Rhizopus arrhizus]|nr:hypothetical protein G6F37_001139 [Rhizopus arrhizus]
MHDNKEDISFKRFVDAIHQQAQAALDDPYVFKRPIKNVAVIGAGAHGLCSARHLKDVGMHVKVFERNSSVGGLWKYSATPPPKPKIPTDSIDPEYVNLDEIPPVGHLSQKTLGTTPEIMEMIARKNPPSGCYRDLYTNIPSKNFAFPDFPFPDETPTFITHQDVLAYFERYAKAFGLLPLIEFNTGVDQVMKTVEGGWELVLSRYEVCSDGLIKETRWREHFDAVVAASGMHQEPFVPNIKGLADYNTSWPLKAVLIIGARISGVDIARSLEGLAKSITISIKGPFVSPNPIDNIIRALIPKCVTIKPVIVSFSNPDGKVDGSITFEDGSVMKEADQVIFCTGYTNSLGYLKDLIIKEDPSKEESGYANIPEGHVVLGRKYPLNTYHEAFLISDPTLCFMSMPRMFSLTPHFDTQAIAIARVWSGQAYLPTSSTMGRIAVEFKPEFPADAYASDRIRREVFVSWLNYQAQRMDRSDLALLKNFDPTYEEEGRKLSASWGELTEANFKKTKKKILASI